MRIAGILWLDQVVDKLASKHSVETYEVEELLSNQPKFRFAAKGDRPGEDVYLGLGQTDGGRFLVVYFIYKRTKEALILSSRDMEHKERRIYERK